jgi:hypothetical protein
MLDQRAINASGMVPTRDMAVVSGGSGGMIALGAPVIAMAGMFANGGGAAVPLMKAEGPAKMRQPR